MGLMRGNTPYPATHNASFLTPYTTIASRFPPAVCPLLRVFLQRQSAIVAARSGDGRTHSANPQTPTAAALLDAEIFSIALPMLAALAADPIAGLVDTAFVGRLGAVELAGVGVALSIFHSATKLFNMPLLAVTTTTVAAANALAAPRPAPGAAQPAAVKGEKRHAAAGSAGSAPQPPTPSGGAGDTPDEAAGMHAAQHKQASASSNRGSSSSSSSSSTAGDSAASGRTGGGSSAGGVQVAAPGGGSSELAHAVSSAIMLAAAAGVFQALLVTLGGPWLAGVWGAPPASALWRSTTEFLILRGAGAPAAVMMLTLQGVFRGMQDTQTPLRATLLSTALNVALCPVLIFGAGWGVRGAAMATVLAQTISCAWLLLALRRRVPLSFGDPGTLSRLLSLFGPTSFVALRTLSITVVFSVATSMVARLGVEYAAAHQIAFQLWLATSLMADSLAVATQTLLARSLAAGDGEGASSLVRRTTQLAVLLGLLLAALLAGGRTALPALFTSDAGVLSLISTILPIVVLTQPVNALAFMADGILFGANGFRYASVAMAASALPALGVMLWGAQQGRPQDQLLAVWCGLATLMAMRGVTTLVPLAVLPGVLQFQRFVTFRPQQAVAVAGA